MMLALVAMFSVDEPVRPVAPCQRSVSFADPTEAFKDTDSQASETIQEWYDRHPELERPPAAFAAVPSSSGSPSQVSHAVASCWLVAPVALLFHALLSGWRELCFSWEPAALACGAVRLSRCA